MRSIADLHLIIDEPVLYQVGLDGMPTDLEYHPEAGEGPLTAEEVAFMLHELCKGQ